MTEGRQELLTELKKLMKRVHRDLREFQVTLKELCDQAQSIKQELGEIYLANRPGNSKEVQMLIRTATVKVVGRRICNKASIRAYSEEQRLKKKLRAELARLIAEVSK